MQVDGEYCTLDRDAGDGVCGLWRPPSAPGACDPDDEWRSARKIGDWRVGVEAAPRFPRRSVEHRGISGRCERRDCFRYLIAWGRMTLQWLKCTSLAAAGSGAAADGV